MLQTAKFDATRCELHYRFLAQVEAQFIELSASRAHVIGMASWWDSTVSVNEDAAVRRNSNCGYH
jgi:hypothetical protein